MGRCLALLFILSALPVEAQVSDDVRAQAYAGVAFGGFFSPNPFSHGGLRALAARIQWERPNRGMGYSVGAFVGGHFRTADDISPCWFRKDGSCWPHPAVPRRLTMIHSEATWRISGLRLLVGTGLAFPSNGLSREPQEELPRGWAAPRLLLRYGGELILGKSQQAPVLSFAITRFRGQMASANGIGALGFHLGLP
jgi:hypothetical protein